MTSIENILVTGGAGGFGRAFCRFILANDMAKKVCVYSRSEHSQAEMREELGDHPRLRMFIGDIREPSRLDRAMRDIDLVIHAAALKRIQTGRYDSEQMALTNVMGSINVLDAARRAGVARIVALSSDKACLPQPGSAYGQSKALMETIILTANESGGGYPPITACTRFGNLWCSPGSVVPKWAAMIRAGSKKVPLTNPDATRFYLTMDEAVQLVAGTAYHMRGGEIAAPSLPAYRIGDLVEAFGVEAEIVGMPTFEKAHEMMREGSPSNEAPRLSVDFLRDAIAKSTRDGAIRAV